MYELFQNSELQGMLVVPPSNMSISGIPLMINITYIPAKTQVLFLSFKKTKNLPSCKLLRYRTLRRHKISRKALRLGPPKKTKSVNAMSLRIVRMVHGGLSSLVFRLAPGYNDASPQRLVCAAGWWYYRQKRKNRERGWRGHNHFTGQRRQPGRQRQRHQSQRPQPCRHQQ